MEEDAAIIWDSELNAEFFDEDAAPSMPPSSRADGDSAITPAAQKSAKPTVASASKQATAIPKTAAVRGSSAAPASASETRSVTPAARSRGSAKSAPRVRRFLYPAASQIARDTPDRRRLPRPALHTPASAERRHPATADTALTPAEQRDVQACLETAMETLDDDADTFFTQCRVSRADCEGSLQANSVTPSKTLSVQAQRQAVLDGAKGDGGIPMETGRTTGDVSLRKSSMQASSKSVHPHTITPRERPGSSSRASIPRHLTRQPMSPLHTPGSVQRTATAVHQVKKHDLQNWSAPGPSAAPISGQSGTLSRPVPVSVSDHRTPAGRPAERVGRTAKRLWSAAAAAESEDDEPGCSPVLSSHKKRRRQDRRPAATPTSQSPMENVLQEHTITNMQEVVADDKAHSSTSRAPLDLAVLAKCGDIGEFAGFSTAAGRKLAVSEQAMQKAVALLKEADAPSSDCDVPSTSASRNIVGASDDEMPHGLPSAAVGSSVSNDQGCSHADTSRRTELLKSGIEASGAAGHGNEPSVGFKTAGGKKLVISEKAVILARAKFAELEETLEHDEVRRTNEERLDDVQLGGSKQPSPSPVTDQNMNSLCSKKNESVSMDLAASAKRDVPNVATSCVLSLGERLSDSRGSLAPGFQTASGKRMTVSAKALDKAKALVENIDEVEPGDAAPKSGPSMSPSSTARLSKACEESGARAGCSSTASARDARLLATSRLSCVSPATVLVRESLKMTASAKAKGLLGSDVAEPLQDGGTSKHRAERSVGFATANGKAVTVSDAALKKAKVMLDSVAAEETMAEKTTEPAFKRPAGFATAIGKAVTVSDAALKKAKFMLDSVAAEETMAEKTTEPAFKRPAGFATASGKAVTVSAAALKKAKVMLDSVAAEETMAEKTTEPAFKCPAGFATASGKAVTVSAAALKKAKAILDDDLSEPLVAEKIAEPAFDRPAGFATASGKAVAVSDAALKKAKAMLDSDLSEPAITEKTTEPAFKHPAGFPTAGGKAVAVSEAAIKKAKALLDNDVTEPMMTEDASESRVKRPAGFAMASGKAVTVSDDALKKAKAMLDSDVSEPVKTDNTPASGMKRPAGFATASGKAVAVSDAALKKAKAMLDSVATEETMAENTTEPALKHPAGFATASGKAVAVSDAALKKAKAMLDSVAAEETMAEKTTEPAVKRPAGFATASGKAVAVSDAALKKVKTLFDDDEHMKADPWEPEKHLGGFATAGGRHVQVSEAALKKARAKLNSDTLESHASTSTEPFVGGPSGFSTAAGKSVHISEDALRNAKAMLDGVEQSMETDDAVQRVSAASRRSGTVSEAAVEEDRLPSEDEAIKNKENINGTSDFDQNTRRGLKRDLSRSMKDSNLSADADVVSSTSVTPDLAAVRRPKVRFLSCDAATRERGDRRLDVCAAEPTTSVASSSAAPATGSTLSRVSVHPGTAPPAADSTALAAAVGGQGREETGCAGDDTGGLTQLLDDKFEFTQVVAERRRRAEEERSASPVLGSARRQRRRRTAEPAVFRTPYRSGAPPPISSRTQPAEPAAPSADPPAASPAATESPSAPQEDTAGAGSKQEVRAAERRRQSARVASGTERRVTRSVGSLLQSRLDAAAVGTGRRSLRVALGQLPANLTRDELQSLDVPADVLNVTFTSAPSYRFKCTETTITADGCMVVPADDDTVGVEEVRAALLSSPSVQPSLVPERWLENAYRHVVWKLAAYERQFPDEMAGRCLTIPQLVSQLRYRYDRELDRCQRPALRRITEGDDTAAKTLILCVAEVNTTPEGSARLVLSDGWYCVPAQGDAALERLVRLGRIRSGLKLAIHGAELNGQQEPCSPLEISSDTYLRFSANSCRRARWDARLGYHSNPAPFASGLRAVLPDGGAVARLDAAVARVYPLLYYEKGESGGVFLTTRCERRRAAAADAARDARLERLYADVERELGSQERPGGAGEVRRPVSRGVVRQLSTGQQIYECVAAAADPGSVESLLTEHQKSLAAEYQRQRQELHRGCVETEFRARLEQEKSAHRPAAPLLKIRLAGRNNMPVSGALLTLWRPSDELQAFLVEGKSVSLFGVAANGKRSGVLQLSSGGGQLRVQPGPPGLTAPPRVLAGAAGTRPPYGELDVAALVVRVTPGAGSSETVHLADRTGRLLSAVCWPGLKALSLDGLVEPGARLAFANLQLCSAPAGRPPLCSLSDRTEVSRRPAARHLIDELRMLTDAAADAEFETSARAALDAVLAAAPARPIPTSLSSPGVVGAAYCPVTPPACAHPGQWSPAVTPGPGAMCYQVTPPACAPGPWSPAVTPGGPAGDGSAEAARSAPVRRLQALQRYGAAPPISPLAVPLPPGVRRPFRSPRPTAAAPVPDDDAASASAASEIIRLSRLEPPTEAAACDSPPIEPESQLA